MDKKEELKWLLIKAIRMNDLITSSSTYYILIGYDNAEIKYMIHTIAYKSVITNTPIFYNDWNQVIPGIDANGRQIQTDIRSLFFSNFPIHNDSDTFAYYIREDPDIDLYELFGKYLTNLNFSYVKVDYRDFTENIMQCLHEALPFINSGYSKIIYDFMNSFIRENPEI